MSLPTFLHAPPHLLRSEAPLPNPSSPTAPPTSPSSPRNQPLNLRVVIVVFTARSGGRERARGEARKDAEGRGGCQAPDPVAHQGLRRHADQSQDH